MKKSERATLFLRQNHGLLRCPVCQEDLAITVTNSVKCCNNHHFDLSKKGTLYLVLHGVKSDYDDLALWQARRAMMQAGLFAPIITEISAQLPKKAAKILDIGCGEGYALTALEQQRTYQDVLVGFDLSKTAINLATQQATNAFFCNADLAALPFQDASFDCLIELFSPSAYQEFKRVLKPQGRLLKVVPNENYLLELRQALYFGDEQKQTYSNKRVVELFYKHYPHAKCKRICYRFALTPDTLANLLKMTPLQWGASQENKMQLLEKNLKEVTVDVSLLIG